MVGFCEHSNEPWGSINLRNFLISGVSINFSRKTLHHVVSSKCLPKTTAIIFKDQSAFTDIHHNTSDQGKVLKNQGI
jgi:hypothetical protein